MGVLGALAKKGSLQELLDKAREEKKERQKKKKEAAKAQWFHKFLMLIYS